MSRFLRPLGVTLAVGLPFLNALSDSSHRRGIARQGHSSRAHAPSATSTVAAAAAAGVEEEQPVEFNAEHYPKGLNAGFLTRSKEQVVEFYATDLAEGMCDRLRERIAEEAIRNAIVYVLLVVTVHL